MDKRQALEKLAKTDLGGNKTTQITLKDTKDGLLALVLVAKTDDVVTGRGVIRTDNTGVLDNTVRCLNLTLTTTGGLNRVGVADACDLMGVTLLGNALADACLIQ